MNPVSLDHTTLRSLFAQAIALDDPAHLRLFLESVPGNLRPELERLLEADRGGGSEHFVSSSIARELTQAADSATALFPAQRFGPFETDRLLGRGGMGSVFKAHRIDGEISQTVAIKVVENAWLDPSALDRFRQERQFLAGLSHPNIARLLDGGTRSDGILYLVMEYIDGRRIDHYCQAKELSLRQKIDLFLPLCDAVGHAHERFIVHRDLKPSNVMVTEAGIPKLLDFGIAKGLNRDGGQTSTLVLTPDFASPEQIKGEEITTATDVYGLGALLYFLLAGQPPHQTSDHSPAALQRAICETAPVRPSLANRQIKPDLENILLKALHVEPSRRYRSARDLAEDLQAFLANRPVKASPDSALYRLRRFVERNQIATAAAVLALLAILAGTAVSLYEAHRAQQRFAQVRELADRFIFDFEASIRQTPGTLQARRKMAVTASRYLASLEADAGHDPSLQRELAESYYRLSVVHSEAQEYDAWLRDLKNSAAILQTLGDDLHGPDQQRALYMTVLRDIVAYWVDRTPANALPIATEAMRDAQAFQHERPGSVFAARALVMAQTIQGTALANVNRLKDSAVSFHQAVAQADSFLLQFPADEELRVLRIEAGIRQGAMQTRFEQWDQAFTSSQTDIALLDPLLSRHPENIDWRIMRIRLAIGYASALRHRADKDASLRPLVTPAFRDAYLMAKNNADQNPGSHRALDFAYVMASRYATQLGRDGDLAAELATRREASAFLETLSKSEPNDHRTLILSAQNLLNQGQLMLKLQQWEPAQPVLASSIALLTQIQAQWPDDKYALDARVSALLAQTSVDERFSRLAEARRHCKEAMQAAGLLLELDKDEKTPVTSLADLRLAAHRLGIADSTANLK